MQSRAARTISKAIVAVGTAGAVATACWLLNRILERKRVEVAKTYINAKATSTVDNYDRIKSYQQQQEHDAGDSFALLPVVPESDGESEEDAMGYTADYFTPHYDVCMLSVSVQTLVDPLPDVPPVDRSECRLCRAAAKSCDTASDGVEVGEKVRALSFSDTETSSNTSVLSMASECGEDQDEGFMQRPRTCSRTEQWLYVRL